jgi:hypothetical protein
VFSLTQTGSAFILIASFFGTAPSIITTPFTSPAVAVSTFWPAGVADGDSGFCRGARRFLTSAARQGRGERD